MGQWTFIQKDFCFTAGAILTDLANAFPGLLDGNSEVNGAELVAVLSEMIQTMAPEELEYLTLCARE